MITIELIARAALDGESLRLRSLCQDFIQEFDRISDCPCPVTDEFIVLATAASLVELLALRANEAPPAWAASIGALPEPLYLVKSAATMKNLRALCDAESPEPLRKRGLLAPPNFLQSA